MGRSGIVYIGSTPNLPHEGLDCAALAASLEQVVSGLDEDPYGGLRSVDTSTLATEQKGR